LQSDDEQYCFAVKCRDTYWSRVRRRIVRNF